MTSQEATFWVACGLVVIALIFGGLGAAAGESKQKEAETIMMALAAAFIGMGMIGFGKWVLMIFIN